MAGPETREAIISRAVTVTLNDGLDIFSAADILTVAGIDQTKLNQIQKTLLEKVGELADDPPLV